MPARNGGLPGLGLLGGVVGEAGSAGDGEPDRTADQEERRAVLRILAKIAGHADRGKERVGDLAGA
jgi:hypothetical protein